jgi:hypothetical protein
MDRFMRPSREEERWVKHPHIQRGTVRFAFNCGLKRQKDLTARRLVGGVNLRIAPCLSGTPGGHIAGIIGSIFMLRIIYQIVGMRPTWAPLY